MIQYVESQSIEESQFQQRQKKHSSRDKSPIPRNKQKNLLIRQKSRDNFLTDPSEHTAKSSSNQATNLKLQLLEQKLSRLSKQNFELKETIITMKANQFYTINEDKVKEAIHENERLKVQLNRLKKDLQELKIQNEYLQRNNKNLKQKLGQIAQSQVRKSIDLTKSRNRQNTSRTILKGQNNNQGRDKFYKQQVQSPRQREAQSPRQNPNQLNALKNQRRPLQHIRSNPNLLANYDNCRYRESEESGFSRKQRDQSLQKQNRYNKEAPAKNVSKQHFLRQFQKYEKQMSSRSKGLQGSKAIQEKQTSTGRSHEFREIRNLPSPKSNSKKQSTLQNILNKKNQLINRIQRQSNDENVPGLANGVRRDQFNQQYLIGRGAKNSNGVNVKEKLTYNSGNHYDGYGDRPKSRAKYYQR